MNRSLLLCAVSLVFTTANAYAGLDLAWNACNTNGGALTTNFDCADGAPSILYGSWQVPVNQDSVVSLDGSINITTQTGPSQSFWQFDGCNQGYSISHVRPGTGCAGSFNMWSPAGSGATITYLPPGSPGVPPGNNRAVFLFTVSRPSSINVPAARNNFGFSLTFLMDAAEERGLGGTCEGCQDGIGFTWISANLNNVRTVNPEPYALEGAGLTSRNACANNPPFSCTCPCTATKKSTWGRIKSWYQ